MRIFVFGIGGTGARVITSLVMQLVAGARPKDENGNVIKEGLSIVPILIDPHSECDALTKVCDLLNDYRALHTRLYPKGDAGEGFFSVKIESLHDVDPTEIENDSFAIKMSSVSSKTFKEYIGATSALNMTSTNEKMANLLFSETELDTEMSEGFYGSPNIGCVALNSFIESKEFRAFTKAVKKDNGDKVFLIGSIFGGTGASGMPLFVTNIRHLLDESSNDASNAGLVQIGTLIVMPYFSIGQDNDSPINDGDFMIKTRSALSYYFSNLNRYINNTYYIADWGNKSTTPFENDPGDRDNQKGNKAHFVEFAGAMSLFNFISSSNYKSDNGEIKYVIDYGSRKGEAISPRFYAYGIDSDNESISNISIKELGSEEKSIIELPLMKFYILKRFMMNMNDMVEKPFEKVFSPKLDLVNIANKPEIQRIFTKFETIFAQFASHGIQAHNFTPYNAYSSDSYTDLFNGISTKSGFLGRKTKVDKDDLVKVLNKVADTENKKNLGLNTGEQRWYHIANIALNELINDNYNL